MTPQQYHEMNRLKNLLHKADSLISFSGAPEDMRVRAIKVKMKINMLIEAIEDVLRKDELQKYYLELEAIEAEFSSI